MKRLYLEYIPLTEKRSFMWAYINLFLRLNDEDLYDCIRDFGFCSNITEDDARAFVEKSRPYREQHQKRSEKGR